MTALNEKTGRAVGPSPGVQSAEMRVCLFGTFESNYARTHVVEAALEAAGFRVIRNHVPVWERYYIKSDEIAGVVPKLGLALRIALAWWTIALRFLTGEKPDVLLIGHFGWFDALLARLLVKARPGPLIALDPVISLYETLVENRMLVRERSATARLVRALEALAYRSSHVIIYDTFSHINYISDTFGVAPARLRRVVLGADESAFPPRRMPAPRDRLRVLFTSLFEPDNGAETIVRAAALLDACSAGVDIQIVGRGQDYPRVLGIAEGLGVRCVTFSPCVPYARLTELIAEADVCLGTFRGSHSAERMIANKVFQAIASRRPVITQDGPAIREFFEDGEEIILVPSNDPAALRDAILRLRASPALRTRIARGGYRRFRRHYSRRAMGRELVALLDDARRSDPRPSV